jgi:hypothetical protein
VSWGWAIAAGVVLGVVYTLSPLTVLCTAGLIAITRWVGKDLAGRERDWFFIVFVTAILLRYVVIGGLLLSADDSRPYTVFFGDEWIFKSRPIWLRNIGLGIPISAADFIYAYDVTGMSGHLYALAFLQALVGDAPYGVHVFNVMLYVGAVAILYRLMRRSFGPLVALGGSTVLLFLPSLFAWSVSVLKEPIYIALSVVELLLVLAIVRAPRRWQRGLSAAAVVLIALAMEELRNGTLLVVGFGTVVGLSAYWVLQTWRRIVTAFVLVPAAIILALAQPPVQARLLDFGREAARYHVGHVMTPGVSYKIVDSRYYVNQWTEVRRIGAREALQYVVRAPIAYLTEPTPANVQSRLLWAYLPEHFAWLLLIGLVPFGLRPAFRRDALATTVLVAHGGAIAMIVALTSGNIGTLIRHRDLALPYLVWFSMLGASAWLARVVPRHATEGSVTDAGR